VKIAFFHSDLEEEMWYMSQLRVQNCRKEEYDMQTEEINI